MREIVATIWKTQRTFMLGAIIFTICMLALLYGLSKFREYRIDKRNQTPPGSELQKHDNNIAMCRMEELKINSMVNRKAG